MGLRLTGTCHTCRRPEKGPCSSRENFTLERSSAKYVGGGGTQGSPVLTQLLQTISCRNPTPHSPFLFKGAPLCSTLVQLMDIGPQKTGPYPSLLIKEYVWCRFLSVLANGDLHIATDRETADALGPCSSVWPPSWRLLFPYTKLNYSSKSCPLPLVFPGCISEKTTFSVCPHSRQLKTARSPLFLLSSRLNKPAYLSPIHHVLHPQNTLVTFWWTHCSVSRYFPVLWSTSSGPACLYTGTGRKGMKGVTALTWEDAGRGPCVLVA